MTADTALPCDDDGDDCRDGARGGVPACPGAVRHCRRARDGERMRVMRAVMRRYGDRNPLTTPSLEDTDLGRSGFPGVPSFLSFLIIDCRLSKANDHYRIQMREVNTQLKSATNHKIFTNNIKAIIYLGMCLNSMRIATIYAYYIITQ